MEKGDNEMGHLILTRNIGQSICIGENNEIEITLMEIRGNQIRVSISADKKIPVHRKEIFYRILDEKRMKNNENICNDNNGNFFDSRNEYGFPTE